MRRAVVTDATAVGDLTLTPTFTPAVRRVIRELRVVYAAEATAAAPDVDLVDALFMYAALSVLLEEHAVAREVIAVVRHRDRTDRATRILVRLLTEPKLADGDGQLVVLADDP